MQSTRSQGGCRGQDARNQVLRDSVKGKEDRDCCGLNGGCKGDVLKDGLQARGTGRIGPTFSVRAIGGHLDRDHSRLHSCGVEGMSGGNSRANMQLSEDTKATGFPQRV